MSEILICGGSGLIGSKLIKKLKQKNHHIVCLSTQKQQSEGTGVLYWNPAKNIFPELDLSKFDVCFNFCGAGIFDKTINNQRKTELHESRILPIRFLREQLQKQNCKLPQFIGASAVGIYPGICLNELKEDSTHGNGFLPALVEAWEEANNSFASSADIISTIRISNVMAKDGGFLKKLADPIRYYIGAVPGSGKQMQSWIHIDDLCDMLIFVYENRLAGTYNATAPEFINLGEMCKHIAKTLKRPLILPNVPVFALRILFGKERTQLILTDQRVSSELIREKGFKFRFPDMQSALRDLLA